MALIRDIILFLHLLVSGLAELNKTEPFLQVLETNSWEMISIPEKNQTILNLGYNKKTFDDLIIICKAAYPVQWKLSGYTSNRGMLIFDFPKRDLLTGIYSISANLTLPWASLNLSCEAVGDSTKRNEILIFSTFMENNEKFVFQKQNDHYSVENSKVLSCSTMDPVTEVFLYKIEDDKSEHLILPNIARYHPTVGFYSDDFFNGTYECRQGSKSLALNASVSVTEETKLKGYQFFPDWEYVDTSVENTVKLTCSTSLTQNLKIVGNRPPKGFRNFTIKRREKPSNKTYAEISISKLFHHEIEFSTNESEAYCVAHLSANESFRVMKWRYQFFKTPSLVITQENSIQCFNSKLMRHMICRNNMDCNFKMSCLRDKSNCNTFDLSEEKEWASDSPSCAEQKCTLEKADLFNGAILCSVHSWIGGLSREFQYFTALDGKKYMDWNTVSKRDLVRLESNQSTFYSNETSQFFCIAVPFLFTDRLYFEIVYTNGSTNLLQSDNVTVNTYEEVGHLQENGRKLIGFLEINLDSDAVGISCIAQLWNSTEVVVDSVKFKTKHLVRPQFKIEEQTLHNIFYVGESQRELTCLAVGDPVPHYVWQFYNRKALDIFPELEVFVSDDGISRLKFPEIRPNIGFKYAGEYHCLAVSRVGNATQKVKLDIYNKEESNKTTTQDNPLPESATSDSTTVTIVAVTAVVVLAFIVLIAGLLVFFIRKYSRANAMIRDLSDTEVTEFFKGRLELVANSAVSSVEKVDFLPYNQELEIPLENLQFDISDDNVLGSGEFAVVVRAMLIIRQIPVALKISKPSADVTLFKSLLSEVKVMSYIGEHENIVGLLGVCTEKIQSRSIYIAIEICELGSLYSYLKQNKDSYINLLNDNQEIEIGLAPTSFPNGQINTLELVNFCTQIANGMEYLTYKSVIHADLATRNVLLTSDKTCKISDFGLSKKLYENSNYVKKSRVPLPWRWMAIESLRGLSFSTFSDTWAYGVTLFEIFTLGDVPFPNESWNEDFVDRLENGMRMGAPKYSTQEIYEMMLKCWDKKPELRPSFSVLREFFGNLLQRHTSPDKVIEISQNMGSSSSNSNMYTDLPKYESLNPLLEDVGTGSTELLELKKIDSDLYVNIPD